MQSEIKTALVTGATGFIGANLVRVLLERGRRVKVLVRSTSNRSNIETLDIEICEGDLRDPEAVSRAVKGCDEVYHVAAEYSFWSANPAAIYDSNIKGTENVMQACLEHRVGRVVYTSTVGAIGLAAFPGPCNEETPLKPGQLTGHYKRSKFEAERTAIGFLRQGLPLVVVNPSAPVGPWDRKPTPTGRIIVDFARGKMPAYLDTGLNIVHVRDVAVGHVLAAEKGRIGERYILGNQNISLKEILAELATILGKPVPRMRIPYSVAWLAGFVCTKASDLVTKKEPLVALEAVKMAKQYMYFDASKAVRELGLPQTPVRQAFQDAVDWYLRHGYFTNYVGERGRHGDSAEASN